MYAIKRTDTGEYYDSVRGWIDSAESADWYSKEDAEAIMGGIPGRPPVEAEEIPDSGDGEEI